MPNQAQSLPPKAGPKRNMIYQPRADPPGRRGKDSKIWREDY